MNILSWRCAQRLAMLAVAALAGCASTPPAAKFSHRQAESVFRASDTSDVSVDVASGVAMESFEKSRVAERIKTQIAAKEALNPSAAAASQYQVDVIITRYEKGNAFARAMLAGLGQIHMDGKVNVYAMPERRAVEDFVVEKTFAWGGIYGSSTTIEDIEQSFAEGIANALTGQGEKPAPNSGKRVSAR
jgi:hypothetical protein